MVRILTNDSRYECENCEEIFEVFSSSGTTDFCPKCGMRVMGE